MQQRCSYDWEKPAVGNLHYLTWLLWISLREMLGNACANQQIAFARSADEPVAIANGHALPPAFNETRTLQGPSRIGDRRSVYSQHFRQQILGDGQAVLVMPVAHHEEPPRQPRFEVVRTVAGCRYHYLLEKCVHMSEHEIAKGQVLYRERA